MSALLMAGPWQQLMTEQQACWLRLRSLKVVAEVIGTDLGGQAPNFVYQEVARVEPLSSGYVGYPVDEAGIVGPWRDALSALATNADTELPGERPPAALV